MTTFLIVTFCAVCFYLVRTTRLAAQRDRYTKFLSKTGVDENIFTFTNFSNKEHNQGHYGKAW